MSSVLIVENEKPQQELLSLFFKEASFKVLQAQDGEEALKLALEYCPEVVLLDIAMPKKNGFEVCMRLRQQEKTKNTKVIFYTARCLFSDWLKAVEAGATSFLCKPLLPSLLVKKVQEIIS